MKYIKKLLIAVCFIPMMVVVFAAFGDDVALDMLVQYVCWANGGCK